jgi:hypothetical protein
LLEKPFDGRTLVNYVRDAMARDAGQDARC